MEFQELINEAKKIRDKYSREETKEFGRPWNVNDRLQGFIGDVGDLSKLMMVKNGVRKIDNAEEKLKHELADCLWSVMIIADELGVDLEKSFLGTMQDLNKKLDT
jgi:NTP pyrophosphatase (non-canonical NTP hydrolase)